MRHPTSWPARLHPLVPVADIDPDLEVDGDPNTVLVADTSRTVEAFQLRADLASDLLAWTGGDIIIAAGAPALRLDGGATVHLGDYVVRDEAGDHAEPADGFWQRWSPADEGPP